METDKTKISKNLKDEDIARMRKEVLLWINRNEKNEVKEKTLKVGKKKLKSFVRTKQEIQNEKQRPSLKKPFYWVLIFLICIFFIFLNSYLLVYFLPHSSRTAGFYAKVAFIPAVIIEKSFVSYTDYIKVYTYFQDEKLTANKIDEKTVFHFVKLKIFEKISLENNITVDLSEIEKYKKSFLQKNLSKSDFERLIIIPHINELKLREAITTNENVYNVRIIKFVH